MWQHEVQGVWPNSGGTERTRGETGKHRAPCPGSTWSVIPPPRGLEVGACASDWPGLGMALSRWITACGHRGGPWPCRPGPTRVARMGSGGIAAARPSSACRRIRLTVSSIFLPRGLGRFMSLPMNGFPCRCPRWRGGGRLPASSANAAATPGACAPVFPGICCPSDRLARPCSWGWRRWSRIRVAISPTGPWPIRVPSRISITRAGGC